MKGKKPNSGKKPQRFWQIHIQFNLKTIFIGLFGLFILLSIIGSMTSPSTFLEEYPLNQVLTDIKNGQVKSLEVEDAKVYVEYTDGRTIYTLKETSESFISTLEAAEIDPTSVEMTVRDLSGSAFWVSLLTNVLPLVLTVVFFLFLFRQARGAQDNIFSFGQSKARVWSKDLPKVTFSDVAGVDEAKKELEEIVDFLKNPGKYKNLGARTPKGVILVGPSGTGKTLLAKAMAGEAKVPFYSIAGSEFMEMLVGVGAARVRDLFASAKKSAPAIIFIDEVDAIGRMRSVGIMGGHDEREQTLNQILVEMDGFEPNTAVMVVAATNRGDLLDPALTRPGRFDRRVVLDLPDKEGRKHILLIHSRGKPISDKVDWDKVAKRTVGFSGADLENMLNESAILAARENKPSIDARDIEEAATKVKLGPEKRRLQSEKDRRMTAYHEAGHAVVSFYTPNTDPVHRISIVSRGMALGFTLTPPERDRLHETKSQLIEEIAMMMGGRAAEQLIFKEQTSGASNDIDQATRIAKYMVMEFGMSKLGPVNYGPNNDATQWGRSLSEQNTISPEIHAEIDREIRAFVQDGYNLALKLLKQHKDKLDLVAEELLKKETLESEDFEALMGGQKQRPVES